MSTGTEGPVTPATPATPKVSFGASTFLSGLLVVAALFAFGSGLSSLTQATLGVGTLAAGCLLAILARMAQASGHATAIVKSNKERHTS